MKNTNAKKNPIDAFWQEITSTWPSLPQAKFIGAKIEEPVPFMGTRKQISFRRKHPLEYHIGPDEPDITMDDWTREHD